MAIVSIFRISIHLLLSYMNNMSQQTELLAHKQVFNFKVILHALQVDGYLYCALSDT